MHRHEPAAVPAVTGYSPRASRETVPAPDPDDDAQLRPTRIIIADDHPVVLFALENLIGRYPYLKVVGRAQTFPELFDEAVRVEFDFEVAIVDLHMPRAGDGNVREMLIRFRQRFPYASLIVLTSESDPRALDRVVDVPVDGILSKKDPIDLIPVAIVSVVARERYVGPAVRELLEHGLLAAEHSKAYALLSRREREVLTLYASGMSVTGIAARLGRSVKTISAQKCSAMKRLSLSNDTELFRFIAGWGLDLGSPG